VLSKIVVLKLKANHNTIAISQCSTESVVKDRCSEIESKSQLNDDGNRQVKSVVKDRCSEIESKSQPRPRITQDCC